MLIVGLTGGIASGKSTVSQQLSSPPHSIPVVDLDLLARRAVAPGSPALSRLVARFGASRILLPDGRSLDRAALGRIAFADGSARRDLDAIVHPAIRRLLRRDLARLWLRGERVAVVDAPLLCEAGLWRWCGRIALVYCSEPLQLSRLRSRNGLTGPEAAARVRAQAPLASKLAYADVVLDNSGGPQDLEVQVDRLAADLKARSGGLGWLVCWWVPPLGLMWGAAVVAWRIFVKGVGKDKGRRSRAPLGRRGESETAGGAPSGNAPDLPELRRRRSPAPAPEPGD